MKAYLFSLGAGLLVGVLYSLLHVRSPAPPVIALVGLLGILGGEQLPGLVAGVLRHKPASLSWATQVKPHVFGHMPTGRTPAAEREDVRGDSQGRDG